MTLSHPKYGEPLTSRLPIEVNGVVFRQYRTGTFCFIRISDDFRIEVYNPVGSTLYQAIVDGKLLKRMFKSQENAMLVASRRAHGWVTT